MAVTRLLALSVASSPSIIQWVEQRRAAREQTTRWRVANIDRLGLPDDIAARFRVLSGNQQRILAQAAGDQLAAAIPIYLAIPSELRTRAVEDSGRGRWFLRKLKSHVRAAVGQKHGI